MNSPAYGLWSLVILNSLFFVVFAFSFTQPRTRQDWRSLGVFSAFVLALFTEMYGFPLTIYLLMPWLARHYPGIDWLSHDAGHLLEMLFGWRFHPHFGPFHLLGNLLVFGGFILLSSAWGVLYRAQRGGTLAVTGVYASIRHPQYVAFVVIMLGFLLQWPTVLTLLMFPILVAVYARLARREEHAMRQRFGDAYARYASRTPAFVPRWSKPKGGRHEHVA